jgi:hypothetical protein
MEDPNLYPNPKLEPAPAPTVFDHALTAGKLGGLVLPFLGAGVTFIELLTGPLRGKRLNDWYEEVRLGVNDLSQKMEGLTWEKLVNDEAFFSALAQATQAAIKTHQQEKRDALRNAVLNVAAGTAPDEYLESVFLQLVDSFTVYHLRLLALFNTQRQVRIADAPEWLKSGIGFQLAKELLDRGLLETRSHLTVDPHKLIVGKDGVYTFHAQLARLGNQFLSFITEPKVKK